MWRFVVVAGLFACDDKEQAKHARYVEAIRTHFDDAQKCFARTTTVPKNLADAVVFATLDEPTKLECEDLLDKVVKDTATLAKAANVELLPQPFSPFYRGLPDYEYLTSFCTYMIGAHDNLERVAKATKSKKRSPPTCELDTKVQLLDGPTELVGEDRQFHEYWFGAKGVTVLDTDRTDDTITLGRYDGKAWTVLATPPDTQMNRISMRDDGSVLVTSKNQIETLHVLEGTTWSSRAKLTNKSMVVDNLAMTKIGTTLVMSDFDRHFTDVRWSTDGAKTFGKPIKLPVKKDWYLRVRLRPDGAVVGMMTPHEGAAQFEAFLLAPGDKQATKTAALTWSEPGDGYYADTCNEGDVVWVLVRSRHLAVTKDGGKTWNLVGGITENVGYTKRAISCTAESYVVYDKDNAHVHACDTNKCTRIDPPKGDFSFVAIRNKPLELWFGTEFAGVHFRDGKPMQLVVYRRDGDKLVRDRVHLVETSGKLPLLQNNDDFLHFRDP